MMNSLRKVVAIPVCAVCRRPVECFSEMRDAARCVTVYTARCHGAEQVVELADYRVMEAGPAGISVGLAFSETNQLTDRADDGRH
jgi:hypothetical protein